MGDVESLLLVLVAIYLAECIVWVRRGSVLFINWWGGGRWTVRQPGGTLANQHGAALLVNPLPPLGTIFAGHQPAVSVTVEGVLDHTTACLNPTWRPPSSGKLVRFNEIREIARDGRDLFINGEFFLKATSPFVARRLAKWLRGLKELPVVQRQAAIDQHLRSLFDEEKLRERMAAFEKRSRTLRALGNSLFLLLYAISPLLVWRFGFLNVVWHLLAALLVHTFAIGLLFRHQHAKLFPEASAERFTSFLTMLLAPPSAIRAVDVLSKHLLEDFHALALAKALLTEDRFQAFARHVLLDLRHPMYPLAEDGIAAEMDSEFRDRLRQHAESFIRDGGGNVETLLGPPMKTEAVHTAFCPRCHAQFVAIDSSCADCGGRPVTIWPARANAG